MNHYVIKLESGSYMYYEESENLVLEVWSSKLYQADTFSTYDDAKDFAECINKGKDGVFDILSPEIAISGVEIDENNNEVNEKLLNVYTEPSINKERIKAIKNEFNTKKKVFDFSHLNSLQFK